MPGTPNPIDEIIVDAVDVAKADLRGHWRTRLRETMADPNEVRATSLDGQLGIYVQSLGAGFDIDTSDTTTVDDGVNCIRDFDGIGYFLTDSAGASARTYRTVTAAGAVSVPADDADVIIIKKTIGAATTVTIAADRERRVRIVDGKYDAATNSITVEVDGGLVMGAASFVIDSNGGSLDIEKITATDWA
jgi:hypothetical protein